MWEVSIQWACTVYVAAEGGVKGCKEIENRQFKPEVKK
jgi:hypothetical protein